MVLFVYDSHISHEINNLAQIKSHKRVGKPNALFTEFYRN